MHSYLFEPGEWSARGTMFVRGQSESKVDGRARVEHDAEVWRLHMRLNDVVYEYEVSPFPGPESTARWRCIFPDYGAMTGQFTVVGDAILSSFRAESSRHHGFEHARLESRSRYQLAGAIFDGETLLQSWDLDLVRSN